MLRDRDPAIEEGEARYRDTYLFAPRRLVCGHCGYVKDWQENRVGSEELQDWYFRQPLWLQVSCCGEVLWAWEQEASRFLGGVRGSRVAGDLSTRYAGKQTAELDDKREESRRCAEVHTQVARDDTGGEQIDANTSTSI